MLRGERRNKLLAKLSSPGRKMEIGVEAERRRRLKLTVKETLTDGRGLSWPP